MGYSLSRWFWHYLLVGGAVVLGACSSTGTRTAPIEGRQLEATSPPRPVSTPPKVARDASPDTQVFALPETRTAPMAPVPAPVASPSLAPLPAIVPPTDPALRELVAQAERAKARGDPGAARATLERALKIKPDDAQLWFRLAELNFTEGEYEQALVMGQRARELAPGDGVLLAQTNALIERAQQQLTR